MIELHGPIVFLKEGSMIKLKGPIRGPVDRSIIKMIFTIGIPEEDNKINLNGPIIMPIHRRVIDMIGPIVTI